VGQGVIFTLTVRIGVGAAAPSHGEPANGELAGEAGQADVPVGQLFAGVPGGHDPLVQHGPGSWVISQSFSPVTSCTLVLFLLTSCLFANWKVLWLLQIISVFGLFLYNAQRKMYIFLHL